MGGKMIDEWLDFNKCVEIHRGNFRSDRGLFVYR